MDNKLRIIGQNIHLNVAEMEWLGVMQRQFQCTEQEALNEIIMYKREQAYLYEKMGKFELSRMLLQEIDEWDDTKEEDYKQQMSKEIKIILPGV
jgi:hypothetical protein